MHRLIPVLFVLLMVVSTAGAQDVQLRAFGGRTAPLASDADAFSRSYQGGVTAGVGASVAPSERVSLDATIAYQRFTVRPPSAILANNLGVDGTGARYRQSSAYNMVSLETSMRYMLSPSASVQPYAVGGLVNKIDFAEELRVEGNRGTFATRRGRTQYYSLALQAGLGVQMALADPVGAFVEGLLNMDLRGRHSYPLRAGLSVEL